MNAMFGTNGKRKGKGMDDLIEKLSIITQKEMGLKAPFPPNRVKWRASDFRGENSRALLYIDARDVMDRLDEVIGINNWMTEYTDIESRCVCKLTLRYDNDFDWVSKSDVGTQSTFEGEKGMYSDAIKRAAVQHGIGRYLYDDGILQDKMFPLDGKRFSNRANEEISKLVNYHYRMFTNQKAVHLNTLFHSCMTYSAIMDTYEKNKEVIAELKKEDALAANAVGESFKRWAKALKKMEDKNG
jgi:hypothetical protein